MNPVHEIARNFPHCPEHTDDSFTGRLHEQGMWDKEEYWKYEAALYDLTKINGGETDVPREIAWRVVRIFSWTMVALGSHFDPFDGFRVRNMTNEEVAEWRERLQLVTEGFFEGKMPNEVCFAPPNPLLNNTCQT